MDGQGPLLVTAAVAVGAAGVTAAALSLVRFTAPPPERVTGEVQAAAERSGLHGLLARRLHPLEATGVALTAALLLILAMVALFGAMAVFGTRTSLWEVDALGAAWGSRNAAPGSTAALEVITRLGGTTVAFSVTIVAATAIWLRAPRLGPPLFLVTVVFGQALLHNGVKLLVRRERPAVLPLTEFDGFSFPSGHSATAAALFAALALLLSRGRSRPVAIALGAAAAALTAMVAASRVLLGVHWVTDVVGGAALGLLWFTACALAFGGRRLRLAPGALPAAGRRHHPRPQARSSPGPGPERSRGGPERRAG